MSTSKASATPARTGEVSAAVVLQEISGIVEQMLGEYGSGEDIEITANTTFYEDLELESIDLVVLAGHLEARYGSQVNLAEFIADLKFDELVGLTFGQLADYVVGCLREAASLERETPQAWGARQ